VLSHFQQLMAAAEIEYLILHVTAYHTAAFHVCQMMLYYCMFHNPYMILTVI